MDNKLKKHIDRFATKLELLCEEFEELTRSERVTSMLHLLMSIRRITSQLNDVYNKLNASILDPFGLPYEEVKIKIGNLIEPWDTYTESSKYVSWSKDSDDLFSQTYSETIEEENRNYSLERIYVNGLNINRIRENLQMVYYGLIRSVHLELEESHGCISKIIDEQRKLKDSKDLRIARFDKLREIYIGEKWPVSYREFIQNLHDDLSGNTVSKEIYKKYLRTLRRNVEGLVAKYISSPDNIADYLFENRNNYKEADLDELFYHI